MAESGWRRLTHCGALCLTAGRVFDTSLNIRDGSSLPVRLSGAGDGSLFYVQRTGLSDKHSAFFFDVAVTGRAISDSPGSNLSDTRPVCIHSPSARLSFHFGMHDATTGLPLADFVILFKRPSRVGSPPGVLYFPASERFSPTRFLITSFLASQ
jgi:hypothetical protein